MAHPDNLVLGKGKLYFEQFVDDQVAPTGRYRFIGNVPTLTVNQEIQTLDHYSSTGGIRTKDRSVTLQTDMGGQFTTDDMSGPNMALLFQGTQGDDTIGTAASLVETITGAELDTYFQVGTTPTRPEGIGNLTDVYLVNGSDTLDAGVDYDVDTATGMIYLRDDAAAIEAGDDVVVHYGTTAGTRNRVADSTNEVYGALRFIADNPVGTNRDFTWPYVKVTASGDLGFITEEWQTATFDFEVQRATAGSRRLVGTTRYT